MNKIKLSIAIIIIIIIAFLSGILWGYLEDKQNSISDFSNNFTTSNNPSEFTVTNDFIQNSKGKDIFEKFCQDINIETIPPTEMADSWNYENGNLKTSLQINSDKTTDEIYYIKIMATEETDLDAFLKICELEYKNNNIEKAKEWVKKYIGQDKFTTINKMSFKLSAPLGKPILEIYPFNGKLYEQKQEKKYAEEILQ